MTAVFRAYSPSLPFATHPSVAQGRAVEEMLSRNRAAEMCGDPADWIVQRGRIEWETP